MILLRATVVMRAMDPPGILLVAVASILLAGCVRQVQDIAGLSRDVIYLAAYLIATFRE